MLNVKKLLTRLMYRSCGGAFSAGNVAANSYKDITVTYDRAFSAIPSVVVCLNSNSTSPNMGYVTAAVLSRSTTGFTARIFNADSSTRSPYVDWIATISWGGYFLTRFMSTFSHLAERWWEYVERKENAYSTNGESELLNRIAIEKRNSKRGKFGIGGYSAAEHKESDRLGRGYLCGDRFSEHGFVGVRDAEFRDKRINHESFYDNKNHNGLCEIYRSRFIATTSERGWAVC